jgi:hypothetical protein
MSPPSAFLTAKAAKHCRRQIITLGSERRWKVIEVTVRRFDLTRGSQQLEGFALGKWTEEGYGSSAVGYLDRLSVLNLTKQLAGPLSQLPNSHSGHVLLIAHPAESGTPLLQVRWSHLGDGSNGRRRIGR